VPSAKHTDIASYQSPSKYSAKYSEATPDRKNKISSLAQCFDPNLQEYMGSDAFPLQLFEPKVYSTRRDFLTTIGAVSPLDQIANPSSMLSDGVQSSDVHSNQQISPRNNNEAEVPSLLVWSAYIYRY